MKPRIYLDNNATTRVDQQVAVAISQYLQKQAGNPSSMHAEGREARALLQKARAEIAAYLRCKPNEIIFTSGGTESVNMVLQGFFQKANPGHVISSSVEHPCVYANLQRAQSLGWDVSFLSPGLWGAVKPEAVESALRPNTQLISLMAVNNETGVKTDIEAIGRVAFRYKIPFFVDGVALLGKEDFAIPEGVSAMCFSGHKLHAPVGIGFAWIKKNLALTPLFFGGEQEFQRRSGSENLLGIIGLAQAVAVLVEGGPRFYEEMQRLRNKLEEGILLNIAGASVNGSGPRIGNTTNIAFQGLEGELLLSLFDREGVAVSHGSACSSGALEPSRVLLQMGLSREIARSSVRFSLSRFTTEQEIDEVLEIIIRVNKALRKV